MSHKSNKRGLTPTLRYQSRNMTQQDLALLGKKKKKGNLFPRGKPLFSISSQHTAAAAASSGTGIRPSSYIGPMFNTSTVVLGIKHKGSDFTSAFPSPTLSFFFSFFHISSLLLFLAIPRLSWVDFFWQGSQVRVVRKQHGGTVIKDSVL